MNIKQNKSNVNKESLRAANLSFSVIGVIKESWGKVKGTKGIIFISFFILFLLYLLLSFGQAYVTHALTAEFVAKKTVSLNNTRDMTKSPDLYKEREKAALTAEYSTFKAARAAEYIRFIVGLLILPIHVGFFILGIKRASNQSLSLGSLFHYYSKILSLVVAYVIYMTLIYLGLIYLGLLLFILAAIYFMIALSFVLPLIADKNMGLFLAIKTSVITTAKCWFRLLGLFALLLLIGGMPLYYVFGAADIMLTDPGFVFSILLLAGGLDFDGFIFLLIIHLIAWLIAFISLVWIMPLIIISYGVVYRELFSSTGSPVER